MDLNGKRAGAVTPVKDPQSVRPKVSEKSKHSENFNPNLTSPISKMTKSPAVKSAVKPQKPTDQKNPSLLILPSPRNKIRERKFVVAKKNLKREKVKALNVNCKCKAGTNSDKCLCVAYETLRASQDDFFKNRGQIVDLAGVDDEVEGTDEQEKELTRNTNITGEADGSDGDRVNGTEGDLIDCGSGNGGSTSTTIKRTRAKLLENAPGNGLDNGSGRVMHLVQAFEKLFTTPNSTHAEEEESEKVEEEEEEKEEAKRGMKVDLLGFRPKAPETQVSSSSFCPSDYFLTSESLGLNSHVRSSLDSSQGSISNRTSGGGRRSRRHSSESTGTFGGSKWKRRQLRITSQQPFKLRTEERGRSKEEEFVKKVQQMIMEEEKQRIPVAQGLPWTTDEPECLVKPPVKESTRPIDLVLHSDVRAVERAEFDNQVHEKLSFIDQYKMERERQRKLEEEEELRRLRKELVPKAQPMPYFDRPFIPRRSEKHPTIPKEPKFHAPQHKKIKCCMSLNDMYAHQH